MERRIVDDKIESDPLEPQVFECVGRITEFNHFVEAGDEYEAKAGYRPTQWHQEFELLDRVHEDGSPAVRSTTFNVTNRNGDFTANRRNSIAGQHSAAWRDITAGVSGQPPTGMSPKDPNWKQWIGHVFRLRQHTWKTGRGGEFSRDTLIPVGYLGGPDYRYTGTVFTERRRDDTPTGPSMVFAEVPDTDNIVAARVACLLDNHDASEAYDIIRKSDQRTMRVGGQPIIFQLEGDPPPLITQLVDMGFLMPNGTTLTATEKARSLVG